MVTVKIGKGFIKRGVAGACSRCPIALAVNAMLDDEYFAEVGTHTVSVCRRTAGRYVESFDLAPQAVRFVGDFDLYREVQPFAFGLPIDDYVKPEFRN